jgi:hypothetical protein
MTMSARVSMAVAGMGLLALGSAAPAQAAEPYFCQNYARTAVSQVHQAERRPRCTYLLSEGQRWSFEYRVHYDWCLGANRGQAISERDARWNALGRCQEGDWGYRRPTYRPRPWY